METNKRIPRTVRNEAYYLQPKAPVYVEPRRKRWRIPEAVKELVWSAAFFAELYVLMQLLCILASRA